MSTGVHISAFLFPECTLSLKNATILHPCGPKLIDGIWLDTRDNFEVPSHPCDNMQILVPSPLSSEFLLTVRPGFFPWFPSSYHKPQKVVRLVPLPLRFLHFLTFHFWCFLHATRSNRSSVVSVSCGAPVFFPLSLFFFLCLFSQLYISWAESSYHFCFRP